SCHHQVTLFRQLWQNVFYKPGKPFSFYRSSQGSKYPTILRNIVFYTEIYPLFFLCGLSKMMVYAIGNDCYFIRSDSSFYSSFRCSLAHRHYLVEAVKPRKNKALVNFPWEDNI